ncbi:UDP-N-acetylmuramoyl-L-alanyl-D-glutamate--2,6-diaminopimelate ligase [Cysteiniphilum sp. 6C5]|uniref:UDP-N-acetylmuramoyl-L-alanyl-D-glutamate--2, 6-diaminopimelate ligase n=1 Tax=unclassified Cysteiniphilum TaxID=2610889 RepID=UPI003F84AC8E
MKTIAQIRTFLTEINTLKATDYQTTDTVADLYCLIENLYQDHRLVTKNDGFIALKGQVHDGHHYVKDLRAKGVKLILVEDLSLVDSADSPFVIEIQNLKSILSSLASWFYDYPSEQQSIFAVTGTNGKSSICHFLAQSLSTLNCKVGVLGTIGNGIFPTLTDSNLTTLDNLSLQRMLRTFHSQVVNTVAMEASSHAIDQKRIVNVNIQTAIFSNLDVDHLDYHQTMEAYFQAKRKLFLLPSVKKCVINIDNHYGRRLYYELIEEQEKQVFSFSLVNSQADCYMPIQSISSGGFVVDVFFKNNKALAITIPIIGEYNVSNIAAVVCALLVNDYLFADVLKTLPSLHNPKGRLEKLIHNGNALVVIDYAHTADALANALQAVRVQTKGKLYCVFGCGGSREHSKRPLMAKAAQDMADFVIVTEDNSRTDEIKDIVKDIISGFDDKFAEFIVIEDRKQAIEYALSKADVDDVILLAGKGHETYLDKNHQKIYFDERDVVLDFWRKND